MHTEDQETVTPTDAARTGTPPLVGHVRSKGSSDEIVQKEYEDKMVDCDGVARGTQ